MSLRRLRRLCGLNESIADQPETNAEIERRLDLLPDSLRTPVLDALEVLKDAGPQGMTLSSWADVVRGINSDGAMPMGEVLKTAVQQFPIVVKKLAPKTYAWEVAASSGDDEFDPAMKAALGAQVDLTSRAFEMMRAMGDFTRADLMDRLMADNRLPFPVIERFVDHLMDHFSGMLEKTGNRYRVKDEAAPTRDATMQSFRDLTRKA